jgi:hypothetical protein
VSISAEVLRIFDAFQPSIMSTGPPRAHDAHLTQISASIARRDTPSAWL